jgi:NAD(P)H dehydrogenase (quinone)
MSATDQLFTGVFGANGAQGGAIARALTDRGLRVRGLGRRPAPAGQGIEYLPADLGDVNELQAAFEGLTALCFTMPLVYDGELTSRYAENVAAAAVKAGVRRLVFNANTRFPQAPTRTAGFETRRAAEESLRRSGLPVAVVRPTVYLENLLAPPVMAAVNEHGVLPYPVPESTPIAWMSLRDLGAAVAALLAADEFAAETHEIGGEELTGRQLADGLAQGIGRTVAFSGLDPSDFESGLVPVLGEDAASGVAGQYHWMGERPDTRLMTGGTAALARLGVTPSTVTGWASEVWPTRTPRI